MKKIKIIFMLLAVLFAVTTAFSSREVIKVKVGDRVETLQWFEPKPGGNVQLETGWQYLSSGDPGCNAAASPCAIEVFADQTTHNINDTRFSGLKSQSTNFTVAGSYTNGVFEELP